MDSYEQLTNAVESSSAKKLWEKIIYAMVSSLLNDSDVYTLSTSQQAAILRVGAAYLPRAAAVAAAQRFLRGMAGGKEGKTEDKRMKGEDEEGKEEVELLLDLLENWREKKNDERRSSPHDN